MKKEGRMWAYFQGQKVELVGGYKHPQRGLFVEVKGESLPRQSISVWELEFDSPKEANQSFKKMFNLSVKQAKKINQKQNSTSLPYLAWGR